MYFLGFKSSMFSDLTREGGGSLTGYTKCDTAEDVLVTIMLKDVFAYIIPGRSGHPKHHTKCDFSGINISTARSYFYLIFSML